MPDPRKAPRHTGDSPIAKARLAAGLTQEQLAARMGITQKAITNWERGARNPKLATIRKIADALGIDWTSLID